MSSGMSIRLGSIGFIVVTHESFQLELLSIGRLSVGRIGNSSVPVRPWDFFVTKFHRSFAIRCRINIHGVKMKKH